MCICLVLSCGEGIPDLQSVLCTKHGADLLFEGLVINRKLTTSRVFIREERFFKTFLFGLHERKSSQGSFSSLLL